MGEEFKVWVAPKAINRYLEAHEVRVELEELLQVDAINQYRGTSLIRNNPLLGPYSRTMSMAMWWPYGGGVFLMSEVTLYLQTHEVGVELEELLQVDAEPPRYRRDPLAVLVWG